MHGALRQQEVGKFIQAALECSVFVSPKEPGLTHQELFEIGLRAGFEKGEIGDILDQVAAPAHFGDARLLPRSNGMWSLFNFPEEPDYRNVSAFDFVCTTLAAIVRSDGANRAQIDRAVLVARGAAQQLPELDIEAAITLMVLDEHLQEKDGVLRFRPGRATYPLPSEQVRQRLAGHVRRNEARTKAYAIVKDVIGRRSDGRHKAAEPFDAFAEVLDALGYAPFRLWWKQAVAELRHAEPSLSPVAVTVFAAALVEGALTFVVTHARKLGLGVFGSKDFERDPRTWKLDDLVSSACSGGPASILDVGARHRADELVRMRQRIHAGRMLSEFPRGVPDLRPEEARAAMETAQLIVRRVLDWVEKHPPSTTGKGA